jgi:hypothetical protein
LKEQTFLGKAGVVQQPRSTKEGHDGLQHIRHRWSGQFFDVASLWADLARIPDYRQRRGVRYSLAVIPILTVLAKLAGEDEAAGIAEWVKWRAALLGPALGPRPNELAPSNHL